MRPVRRSWLAVRSGLRRNPLRRRVDRVEVFARIVAFVLLCVAVPVALSAGAAVHRADVARSAHDVIQVTATVRQNVAPGFGRAAAHVDWRTPDGAAHSGFVVVVPPEHIGDHVRIWVDATGRATDAPLSPVTLAAQRYLLVAVFVLVVGLVLIALLALLHQWLDRLRYARWDREWRLITTTPWQREP